MACKQLKEIVLTVFARNYVRNDWNFDFDGARFETFLTTLARDMKKLGVALSVVRNNEAVITVNSYADLLNVVKLSSHQDGHNNQCVGHIIGKSEQLDIMEDIAIAVRRVAFAPETIAPSSEFRKVCHNCGCGC
jgi:hypothetical protein